MLAAYAKDNNLLEEPGWKFLGQIAWHAKKFQHMLNITSKHQKATAVQYKFGVCILCTVKKAYALDKEMAIPFGMMQLSLSWPSCLTIRHSRIPRRRTIMHLLTP